MNDRDEIWKLFYRVGKLPIKTARTHSRAENWVKWPLIRFMFHSTNLSDNALSRPCKETHETYTSTVLFYDWDKMKTFLVLESQQWKIYSKTNFI